MGARVKFYFDFVSQPSRALFILLQKSHSQHRYEQCEVNLLKGENLTDEYQQNVNRFKKVPAIIDGDFKLAESVAILRYLVAKQLIDEKFYPSNVQKRARIDEFLSWQHTGIRSSASLYFRFQWAQAYVFGEAAAPGKVAKYKAETERDLAVMETVWLKDSRFVAGDSVTAADIFGACEVEQIRMMGYKVGEKYPQVARWIENVRSELHPYFDEAHKLVYQFERETLSKASK